MAPHVATRITPTDAIDFINELSLPEMSGRAARALDTLITRQRHGAIGQLAKALDVTRATLSQYRDGTWAPSPGFIYKVAKAYAAGEGLTPLDQLPDLSPDRAAEVDEFFWQFYSDNHRDAETWLTEHRTEHFGWDTPDRSALVA